MLTRTTKSWFSCICSFVMSYQNGTKFTVELASIKGTLHFKFDRNPFSYLRDKSLQIYFHFPFHLVFFLLHSLFKNYYNASMNTLIKLKFGTRVVGLKANISIKFGVNLINIKRVLNDFAKKMLNFCHAFRVNRIEGMLKIGV